MNDRTFNANLDRWITGDYGAKDPANRPAASGPFCESIEVELADIEGESDEGNVRVESFMLLGVHVSRSTPLGDQMCDAVQAAYGETIQEGLECKNTN